MADFYEIDFLGVETKKSGDAIVVRTETDGIVRTHVVDGGFQETGQPLCDHIRKYYGEEHFVDAVIATHQDGDHAGGLRSVLEEFKVGALYMNRPWAFAEELLGRFKRYSTADGLEKRLREAYPNLVALEEIAEEKGVPIFEAFQGCVIGAFTVVAPSKSRFLDLVVWSEKTPEEKAEALGQAPDTFGLRSILEAAAYEVKSFVKGLWGEESFPASGTTEENEMSIVQFAKIDGRAVLLTGDAGRDALTEAINYIPNLGHGLPGVNLFQVPHHGSRRNLNSDILDRLLGPKLPEPSRANNFSAVVSSAYADPDHPRKVVRRAIIHRGGHITSTEGRTIMYHSQNAPIRVGWTSVEPDAYPEDYEQ